MAKNKKTKHPFEFKKGTVLYLKVTVEDPEIFAGVAEGVFEEFSNKNNGVPGAKLTKMTLEEVYKKNIKLAMNEIKAHYEMVLKQLQQTLIIDNYFTE